MKRLICLIPYFLAFTLLSQTTYKTFELRHFTNDEKANGETDFHGETEWMDTEQRIQFLNDYARYASRFFDNPDYDKKAVEPSEVNSLLDKIKPQPLTKIRQTIPLKNWKVYGYKSGQDTAKQKALSIWQQYPGANIVNGTLMLENNNIERSIDSLSWRFRFEVKIKLGEGSLCSLSMSGNKRKAIAINISKGGLEAVSNGNTTSKKIPGTGWYELIVEGDFTQKKFNLYLNGERSMYYIPFADTTTTFIDKLSFQAKGEVFFDNLYILNHIPLDDVRTPFYSKVAIDENFEAKSAVKGWQTSGFNDRHWEEAELPVVHGGVRQEGEDFYLRKEITIDSFKRATLEVETIDPGGEVWINGQVVAVVNSRHPVSLDVSNYLKPGNTNLLAIKVKYNKSTKRMGHAPTDLNIGWFMGKAKLILTNGCIIKYVLVNTSSIGNPAIQSHKIRIQQNSIDYFNGTVEINYYPWSPAEGCAVASNNQKIQIRPGIVNEFVIDMPVYNPQLWDYKSPSLYKVEVILKDKEGQPVDDFVTTTGIRVVEQKNGDFYFNGKPAMLNGAQIMGYRTPIEGLAKYNRCPPIQTVAEELLMVKKMGSNLMRMHVHAESDTCDGVNDPRYAEIADQLGMYFIWQTPAWIRAGEAWNIDYEGYPKYMEQVYNHPSIVMWEGGNHPNRFKEHGVQDTHDFVKACYKAISSADTSRLISLTSSWNNTHYANYDGTLDYEGGIIQAPPEFMAKMVTRGNQDTYTGYGRKWQDIRKVPWGWVASCLSSKDKAYFNFEHQESIGQPNWGLCKGKPWYLLQSYEWDYDEGSIGRNLAAEEWQPSQAWQAFSAWEAIKKQILVGYDGFSWCCLHGGANMGTYKKPLIDNLGYSKLAFYTNKMAFQDAWAGSNNVDVVYGPGDLITPTINYLGDGAAAGLKVLLKTLDGKTIDTRDFKSISLEGGHAIEILEGFRFSDVDEGNYIIEYELTIKEGE